MPYMSTNPNAAAAGDPYTTTALHWKSILVSVCAMLVALAAVFVIGVKLGTPVMSWRELVDVMLSDGGDDLTRTIVLEIRLPRFVLGLLVGAMLAAAGMLMQGALNNRLAGPELLGISAGGSLVVAAITVLHLPIAFQLHPVLALAGGLAGGMVVLLAARGSRGTAGMLLVGMSVTAILNGLLIVMLALGMGNDVNLLYTYLLGSLANRGWEYVDRILPWFLAALPAAMLFARSVNLLQLGDETASGLGLNVNRTRIVILLVCTALVAVTVAQCGPIGYISLLAPHVTRVVLRSQDARLVLPASALCGAVMLTAADQLARLSFDPMEIPVGIWTTLAGGTVYLIFVLRRGGRGQHGA